MESNWAAGSHRNTSVLHCLSFHTRCMRQIGSAKVSECTVCPGKSLIYCRSWDMMSSGESISYRTGLDVLLNRCTQKRFSQSYSSCASQMFHLTPLNATTLIPNHLRVITKLLGWVVWNRQKLIKAVRAIWVEFPVMMCFQRTLSITMYSWAQTHPLFVPPQDAQTWWKKPVKP